MLKKLTLEQRICMGSNKAENEQADKVGLSSVESNPVRVPSRHSRPAPQGVWQGKSPTHVSQYIPGDFKDPWGSRGRMVSPCFRLDANSPRRHPVCRILTHENNLHTNSERFKVMSSVSCSVPTGIASVRWAKRKSTCKSCERRCIRLRKPSRLGGRRQRLVRLLDPSTAPCNVSLSSSGLFEVNDRSTHRLLHGVHYPHWGARILLSLCSLVFIDSIDQQTCQEPSKVKAQAPMHHAGVVLVLLNQSFSMKTTMFVRSVPLTSFERVQEVALAVPGVNREVHRLLKTVQSRDSVLSQENVPGLTHRGSLECDSEATCMSVSVPARRRCWGGRSSG